MISNMDLHQCDLIGLCLLVNPTSVMYHPFKYLYYLCSFPNLSKDEQRQGTKIEGEASGRRMRNLSAFWLTVSPPPPPPPTWIRRFRNKHLRVASSKLSLEAPSLFFFFFFFLFFFQDSSILLTSSKVTVSPFARPAAYGKPANK